MREGIWSIDFGALAKSGNVRPSKSSGGRGGRIAPVAVLFSSAWQLLAGCQLLLGFGRLGLPETWLYQSLFLLSLSTILAILGFAVRGGGSLPVALLYGRFVLMLIVSYPLGTHIGIELTLLTSLVFDCRVYFSPVWGTANAVVFVSLAVLTRYPVVAWGRTISAVRPEEMIYLVAYPIAVMLINNLVWHYASLVRNQNALVERLKSASSNLVHTNLRLQDFVALKEEQAILLERRRLSREIHDTIGHTLTSIILTVKAAAGLLGRQEPRIRELLRRAEEEAHSGMEETRRALSLLRSKESAEVPLTVKVDRLVRAFDGTHLKIHSEYGNSPGTYGQVVDRVIFRFIQEGITNAIQHGNADDIRISFWAEDGKAQVSVLDNGDGVDTVDAGIGMEGMKERLSQIGGSMSAGNVLNGFRLTAIWPIE